MSRYAAMFAALAERREAALGGFLMLGDPDLATSARLLDALVAGGADMVEVGIPFSDPVADGPVIQAAAGRALAAGVKVADCFELIARFRARHRHVPVGILTYANIVAARGREAFMAAAAEAGADSLLVADVPAIEATPYAQAARAANLELVMIAAANTPAPTLQKIAQLARGYTYCVARFGVTGAEVAPDFDPIFIANLNRLGAPPPVFGFGISSGDHVRSAIAAGAAGVIVGSALVRLAAQPDAEAAIAALAGELKAATRR